MKHTLFTPLRQIPRQKRMVIEISVALSVISGTVAAAPNGGQVTAGQAVINRNGGQTVINQTSNRAIINWRDFSTARGEGVTFNAPSVNSATLNRVTGNLPSRLDGSLIGNGRVFLINRNGIVVGANGVVNVRGGFVASTQDVRDQDFMNGADLTFTGEGGGKIQVLGTIRSEAGDIVLIAPKIDNQGLLQAGKQVNLVAAEEVVMSNGQLKIKPRLSDAGELTNNGAIEAAAVRLAASNQNFGALAINNSGRITANGVVNNGDGSVRITAQGAGGNVQSGGKVTATNGDQGGRIDITGSNVVLKDGAELDASGQHGGGTIHVGGGWQGKDADLANAQNTTIEQNVQIKADAKQTGNGGEVVVWSDGNTRFNGQISAQGGAQSGNGGNVEVSGKTTLDFQGNVNTLAANGETGNLLLDPTDIHIVAGAGSVDYNQNVSNLGVDTLLGQLATSNVTVKTSNGGTGAGNGDIFVDTDINYTTAAVRTLTLQADRDIVLNNAINSTSNSSFNLDFQAARNISVFAPINLKYGTAKLTTTTGDITLGNNILAGGYGAVTLNSGRDILVNAQQTHSSITSRTMTMTAARDIQLNQAMNTANTGALNLTATAGNSMTVAAPITSKGTTTTGGYINLKTTSGDLTVNAALNSGASTTTVDAGRDLFLNSAQNAGVATLYGYANHNIYVGGDINATNLYLAAARGKVAAFSSDYSLGTGTITFNSTGVNLTGTGTLSMLSGRTGPAGALEFEVGDPVELPSNVNFSTIRNGSLVLAFGSLTIDRPIEASSVSLYSDNLTIGPNAGTIKATSGDILLQAGAYKKYYNGSWYNSVSQGLSTATGPIGLLTIAPGTGLYSNNSISLYSSIDANGKRQGVITPDITFQRYDGAAAPFNGQFYLFGFDSIDLGQSISANNSIQLYARDATLRGDLTSVNNSLYTYIGYNTDTTGGRLHFRKNGLAEGSAGADDIDLRAGYSIYMQVGADASGQRTSLTGETRFGSSRADKTISGSVTLHGFDTIDFAETIRATSTSGYFYIFGNTLNVLSDLEIGYSSGSWGYELYAGQYDSSRGQLNFTPGTTLYYRGYDPSLSTTGPRLYFINGSSPLGARSDFSNVRLQSTSDYNGISNLTINYFGNIELDVRNKDGSVLTDPWSVRNSVSLSQYGQSGHILLPMSFDIGQGYESSANSSTLYAQGAIIMGDEVMRLRSDTSQLSITAGRTSSVNTDARLLNLYSTGAGQTLAVNVANNTTLNSLGSSSDAGNIEVYARGDITLAGQINRSDSNPGSITLQADAQYGKTLYNDGDALQTKDLNQLFTEYNYGIQGEQGGDGLGAFQLSNTFSGATPLIVQPVFQMAYYVDYPTGFVVDVANRYYNAQGVAYAVGTNIPVGTLIYSNSSVSSVSPKLEALNSGGQPMRYQRQVTNTFTTGPNDINVYFYTNGQPIPPGTYLLANTYILVKPGAPTTNMTGSYSLVNWTAQLYGITGYSTTTSYYTNKYTSMGTGTAANMSTAYSNLNFGPTTLGYDTPVNTADSSSYFGKPTNGASNSIGKTLNMSGQFYTLGGTQYAPTHYNEGSSQVAAGGAWDGWELSFGTGVLKVGQGNLTIISGPNDAVKGLPVDFNVHTNTFTGNSSTAFGTYDPSTNRPFAFQFTSKGGDVTIMGFRDIGVSPSGSVSAGGNVTLGAARDLKIENSFILTADKTLTFLAGNAIWAKDGTTFGSTDPNNPMGTLVALAGKSVYLNSNVAKLVGGIRESEANYTGSVAGGIDLGDYNGKFIVNNAGALTILDDYTSPNVDDVTFTSNGILFTGGVPLHLTGIESTRVSDAISGEIRITSGKSITVDGQVNALGNGLASDATLTALNGNISGAGLISGDTVKLTANQGLIDSTTQAATLIATAKNDITLDNTGDTALTANSATGKLTVDNSGTITLTDANSAAGNAVLNASGSIVSADMGSTLTADQISLDAGKRIDVVTVTDTLAARAADGDLAVRNTGDLSLAVQAKNNLDVTTTGSMTTGAVSVIGGLNQSGVASTDGGVGLHADGALNGDDISAATDVVLTAGTNLNVTGIDAGNGTYLNGRNSITATGDFGSNLSANSANGNITLNSNGTDALAFEATAGGKVSLNANSDVTVTDIAQGSVSAGTLNGGVTVSSDAGVTGVTADAEAVISAAGDITSTGSTRIAGDAVSLNATDGRIDVTTVTGELAAHAGDEIAVRNTGDLTLAASAANNIAVTTTGDLTTGSVSVNGGLSQSNVTSTAGGVGLNAGGALTADNLSAAGNVVLTAGGDLTARNMSAGSGAYLSGADSVTASGDFGGSLSARSANGDVALQSTGSDPLAFEAQAGGKVALDADSDVTVTDIAQGSVSAGALNGGVTVSSDAGNSGVNAGTVAVISGDSITLTQGVTAGDAAVLSATSGDIGGAGVITADRASLDATGNINVTTVTAELAAQAGGNVTVNNTGDLTAAAQGDNVLINNAGSLTVDTVNLSDVGGLTQSGIAAAGTATLNGESITLNAGVTAQDEALLTADSGDIAGTGTISADAVSLDAAGTVDVYTVTDTLAAHAGNEIAIRNTGDLTLAADAVNNIAVTTTGDLTSGTVNVAGGLSQSGVVSSDGGVGLQSGGDMHIVDGVSADTDIVLRATGVLDGDNLSAGSGGTYLTASEITLSGDLGSNLSANATAGDVTLTHTGSGPLSIEAKASGNVTVNTSGDLIVADLADGVVHAGSVNGGVTVGSDAGMSGIDAGRTATLNGNDITLNAGVTAQDAVLTADGNISGAGVITADRTSLDAAGSIDVNTATAQLAALAGGDITVRNSGDLTAAAQGGNVVINNTGTLTIGVVDVSDAGGVAHSGINADGAATLSGDSITLDEDVNARDEAVLTADSGDIAGVGVISADAVSLDATGTVDVYIVTDTLAAHAGNEIAVRNTGDLTLAADAANNIAVTTTGDLTSGAVNVVGGLSQSGIVSTDGSIGLNAGGDMTLNGSTRAAEDIVLTAAGAVNGSGLQAGDGVYMTGSSVNVSGDFGDAVSAKASAGDVNLTSTGSNPLQVAAQATGQVSLDANSAVTVSQIEQESVRAGSINGGVSVNSEAQTGVDVGSVASISGDSITLDEDVNAGDAAILTADSGDIGGAGSIIADRTSLDATGNIDVTTVTSELAARAGGDVTVNNSGDLIASAQGDNVSITTHSNLTIGTVDISDVGGLNQADVNAGNVATLNGDSITVTGNVNAGDAAILTADSGDISGSGSIAADRTSLDATGNIDVNTATAELVAQAGGDVAIRNSGDVTVSATGENVNISTDGAMTVAAVDISNAGGLSLNDVSATNSVALSGDTGVVLDANVSAGQIVSVNSDQGAIEQLSGVVRAEEVNLTAQDGITGATGWQNALAIEDALRVNADNTGSGDVVLQNTVNGNNSLVSEVTLNNADGNIRFDQRGGSSLAVNDAIASGDVVLTATDGLANVTIRGDVDAGQSAAIVANKDLVINSGATVHAVDNLLLITDEAAGRNAGDGWLINHGNVSVDSGNLAVYAVAGQAPDGWIASHGTQVDLGNIADTFDLLHWGQSFQGQGGDTQYHAGAGNSGVWYKVPLSKEVPPVNPVDPVNPVNPVNPNPVDPVRPGDWPVAQLLHGFYYGVANTRDMVYVQTYSIGFAADECLSDEQKAEWDKLAAQGEDVTHATWRSVSYLARPTIVVPGSVGMQSMWRTQPSGSLQKPVCVGTRTVAMK